MKRKRNPVGYARQIARYKASADSPHCPHPQQREPARLGVFAMSRGFIANEGRVNTNSRPW